MDFDRRATPRRSHPFLQRIAPIVNGRIPCKSEFRQVPFHDISSRGVAFLLWCPPDFPQAVVELGRGCKLAHLAVEVVHVQEIRDQGESTYLVGCKFLGHVEVRG
jgi:hypothetical protein